MKLAISLSQALNDPELFGKTFAAPSFWTWKTLAKVVDGLLLDEREAALFRECTGSYAAAGRPGAPDHQPDWPPRW